MKKYYSEFAYLFFLGFMSVLGSLLIPIIIGQMVDTLFLDKTMFMTLLVAGIFLTILTAVITYLLEYNAKKTTLKITNRMRNLLSNKYLNGKLEIMERENSGMYAHKYLNNINQINEALSLFLVNFIPGVFTIIISFIIMISKS